MLCGFRVDRRNRFAGVLGLVHNDHNHRSECTQSTHGDLTCKIEFFFG